MQKVSHSTMVRRIIGAGLLTFVLGVPLAVFSLSAVRSYGELAYSPQAVSCLPWHLFIQSNVAPSHIRIGQIVLVHTPKAFHDQPLGKLVVGLPGDVVKETLHRLYINGHFWGRMWLYPWLTLTHRFTAKLPKTYTIPKGHVLLLGTNPESWDGRYWGVVPESAIYGRVYPL